MPYKNKRKHREKAKKWNKNNPEKRNKIKRRWYKKHKEERRKYNQNYGEKNPDIIKKKSKKWNKNNPEKRKKYYREWRLRKKIAGFHILEEWELLKKQYGYICPACGRKEPKIKLTEDHIIPLIKGGSNYIENIQPLCKSCNCKKHTKIIKY